MTVKCRWCGREDVEVTAKGGLGNHTDPAGKRCFAVGMQVTEPTRMVPRPIKGTAQRNWHRKSKDHARAAQEVCARLGHRNTEDGCTRCGLKRS